MKLDRFGVDAIRQPLAFVTISAQAQLLLLISGHPLHSSVANHTKSFIFCSINTPVERRFEKLPSDVNVSSTCPSWWTSFFRCLVRQHSSTSNIVQSSCCLHSRVWTAPACVRSTCPMQATVALLNRILHATLGEQSISSSPRSKDGVAAVRVHLNQLEVAAIKKPI